MEKSQQSQLVHTTVFEVKKYVLPRFQVTVTSPGYILADAENVTWNICAKYADSDKTTDQFIHIHIYSYDSYIVVLLQIQLRQTGKGYLTLEILTPNTDVETEAQSSGNTLRDGGIISNSEIRSAPV